VTEFLIPVFKNKIKKNKKMYKQILVQVRIELLDGATVATVRSKGITKKTSLPGPQKGPCWPSLHEDYQKDVPFWTTKGAMLAFLTWDYQKDVPFWTTKGAIFACLTWDYQKDVPFWTTKRPIFAFLTWGLRKRRRASFS